MPALGESPGALVVDRKPLDVVVERVQRGRGDDPRLAHGAAEQELLPPGDLDQLRPGRRERAERAPEALREAERHGVDPRADRAGGTPSATAALRSRAPSRCTPTSAGCAAATTSSISSSGQTRPPRRCGCSRATSTAGRWSTTSSAVEAAARTCSGVSRPADARDAHAQQARVHRRAAELVDEDVRVLLGDQHVSRAGRGASARSGSPSSPSGGRAPAPARAARPTRSCSSLTVGSSLICSSPTTAAAMAARMPGVGRVTVSERRSITAAHSAHGTAAKRLLSGAGERLVRSSRDRGRCGRIARREGGAPATRSTRPRSAAPGCAPCTPGPCTRRPGDGAGARRPRSTSSPTRETRPTSSCGRLSTAVAGERAAQVERVLVEAPAGPAIVDNARDAELHRRRPARPRAGEVDRARLGEQLRRAARDLPGVSSVRYPHALGERLQPLARVPTLHCMDLGPARADDGATAASPPTARGRSGSGPPAASRRYDAMTNVPAALRDALDEAVPFSTLAVTGEQEARDGTVKTLFRTHDGHPVEAVLMRYRDGRRSICVSSQSGCPLTCTFCATGTMQFGRNLTASEILDQALHFRRLERGRPLRLHGHGRAVPQLRQRDRGGAASARRRDHARGARRSRRSAGCPA